MENNRLDNLSKPSAGVINLSDKWDGKTGELVEYYIKELLDLIDGNTITGGVYENQNLILYKKEGDPISIPVTVVPPNYIKSFIVRNIIYTDSSAKNTIPILSKSDNNIINVKPGDKVEIELAMRSLIQLLETVTDNLVDQPLLFTYGNVTFSTKVTPVNSNNFEYDDKTITGLIDGVEWPRVNITELFTQITSEKNVLVKINDNLDNTTFDTGVSISNINPKLTYSSLEYLTNSDNIQFNISGNGTSQFALSGKKIQNGEIVDVNLNQVNGLTLSGLDIGVNNLYIQAYCTKNNKIKSNYVLLNIIRYEQNTQGEPTTEGTYFVINELPDLLNNTAVSNICCLSAYSSDSEPFSFKSELAKTSYFEDSEIIEDSIFYSDSYVNNLIKKQYVKKYIELPEGGRQFLKIYTGSWDKQNYREFSFFELNESDDSVNKQNYFIINISDPDSRLLPTDVNPSLSFTQKEGESNNVFNLETLIDDFNKYASYKNINGQKTFTIQQSDSFNNIFKSPGLNMNLDINTGFTVEFGLRTYNVNNEQDPFISFSKGNDKHGLLQIRSSEVCWDNGFDKNINTRYDDTIRTTYLNRNSLFKQGELTHITIVLEKNYQINQNDPYFPDYLLKYDTDAKRNLISSASMDILKIYINGSIDREFAINQQELNEIGSNLIVNARSNDVDFYTLKVFNSSLTEDLVRQEYISFLPTINDKLNCYNKNDITTEVEINGKKYQTISFEKASKKYNTLVYVFLPGYKTLTRAYGDVDNAPKVAEESNLKKMKGTLFVNYANETVNNIYGGRIRNLLFKGLGTSAKRYLIWNVQSQWNKVVMRDSSGNAIQENGEDLTYESDFISYQYLNSENKFDLKTEENASNFETSGYKIPDSNDSINSTGNFYITKQVGKVNFASSMQSHKQGACDLFNDAYPANLREDLPEVSRKAVKELPFLYFYVHLEESDLKSDSNPNGIDPEEINLCDIKNKAKFMGFLTWGSGKGDKATYGIAKSRPEYLLLEGAENGDTGTNFKTPWLAYQRYNSETKQFGKTPICSISDADYNPIKGLYIDGESIFYSSTNDNKATDKPAWDIDSGANDDGDGFKNSKIEKSFKKFVDFYNFVYLNDFTIVFDRISNIDNWDTNKKYCVEGTILLSNYVNSLTTQSHTSYDVYRYDTLTGKWVSAGLDFVNGYWKPLNIKDIARGTFSNNNSYISEIKKNFKNEIGNYIIIDDIAYHQAFIKLVSGTDNRAKNTYFLIFGEKYIKNGEGKYVLDPEMIQNPNDSKIRLLGDDLDTIFLTDNQGKRSKLYNLLEPSYDYDDRDKWGDNGANLFFRMFDLCFEDEIITQLKNILTNLKTIDDAFFSILRYFPSVAYNHTAKLYYELGRIIKEQGIIDNGQTGTSKINYYTNNGEDPLSLSNGPSLEGELQFMDKRLPLLLSYAKAIGKEDFPTMITGNSKQLALGVEYSTSQDLYPNYVINGANYIKSVNYPIATECRTKESTPEKVDISSAESSANGGGLVYSNLFKTLNIRGFGASSLYGTFNNLQEFTIDGSETRGFVKTNIKYDVSPIGSFELKAPILKRLTLKNIQLPSLINLEDFNTLTYIDFTGNSTNTSVSLPKSSNLREVHLGSGITSIEVYNCPNLTVLDCDDYSSISKISIRNSGLNVTQLLQNICNSNATLSEVEFDTDVLITEDVANTILNCNDNKIRITNGKFNIVKDITKLADPENLLEISYNTSLKIYHKNKMNIFNFKKTRISNFLIDIVQVDSFVNVLDFVTNSNGNDISGATISLRKLSGGGTVNGLIITKDSNTALADMTLTINGNSYNFTASYKKTLPEIGHFAYADGTFNNKYFSSKDVIGLVYGVDTTNKKAYIIGKEYVTTSLQAMFYPGVDLSIQTPGLNENSLYYHMFEARRLVNNRYSTQLNNLANIHCDIFNVDDLNKNKIEYDKYLGETYTKQIVGKSADDPDTTIYNKAIIDKLEDIENPRLNISNYEGSNGINLGYMPYYQVTRLYKPALIKSTELDPLYDKNHWYVPNNYQWALIITQRAFSSRHGLSTDVSYRDIERAIDILALPTSNGIIPIFAYAKKAGYVSSVWENLPLTDHCLLTSTLANDPSNSYTYSTYQDYQNNLSVTVGKWIYGGYVETSSWSDINNAISKAWCGNLHYSIPFVTYTYND